MMTYDSFNKVDEKDTAALLEEINPLVDGSDFVPGKATILERSFDFYPGYSFLSITNHESVPPRQSHAFYKSGDIVIMDTTPDPIMALNRTVPVVINSDTVIPYLRFYFSQVRGREGCISLVETVEDLRWEDEPTKAAKKAVGDILFAAEILSGSADHEDGRLRVKACAVYKKSVFLMILDVSDTGEIRVEREELLLDDMPLAGGIASM